ncbi:MAG TPA: gluconate 2-dehydrogenase subunit 3 family protein [Opitutaceae bacterium]|jgi:hypothetical protein
MDTLTSSMNRREAIRRIAMLMGGAMVGARFILSGETVPDKAAGADFSDADKALLDEVGETILPETDIPGAKAVGIGAFMAMMVNDCYSEAEHAAFKAGLADIEARANAKYGKGFVACAPAERSELATALDKEQVEHHASKAKDEPDHYFRMIKDLTTLGYFSSEIGCTKAVRYIEVPGSFNGDAPYTKGERAWF